MEKIVAANLKMNFTYDEVKEYVEKLDGSKNFIVCPPNIYLHMFVNKNYSCGSQDAYYEDKGAFTGEVSSLQLRSLGVTYTILGHSERRQLFGDTNGIVNKKVISALKNDLNVILCIGETKEERDNNKTKYVLKEQIENCLKNVSNVEKIIIAYEPIWSIGTGVIPTNDEIKETIDYIKDIFNSLYKNHDVKVLYGGSVNEKNIDSINNIENVSGVLVGGASLDIDKINKIKGVVLK